MSITTKFKTCFNCCRKQYLSLGVDFVYSRHRRPAHATPCLFQLMIKDRCPKNRTSPCKENLAKAMGKVRRGRIDHHAMGAGMEKS